LKHTRPRVHLAYLPPHVDQQQLSELFGATAALTSVKILESRVPGGLNYGFVEFADMQAAQAVVQTFDGYTGFGSPIRVSWAKASNQQYASPPTHHANVAHVFVGDLAPNVDDPMLESFFKTFPSLNDVRVMYDPETGKSRGFGFISFRDVQDAERCIATMKGEWLAGRPVRVNWANQKNHHRIDNTTEALPTRQGPCLFADVLAAAPSPTMSTVYIGNMPLGTTAEELVQLLGGFGYVLDVRIPALPETGYAFIKMDSHQSAANAIFSLSVNGAMVRGRPVRLGW
ncbi:RNA-binding domain-containing protein, partial [Testicularia cyperi]